MNSIFDYISSHIKLTPHKVAIKIDDRALTYEDLGKLSGELSSYLIHRGYSKDCSVIVYNKLSIESIYCALGIIKSGCVIATSHPTYGYGNLKNSAIDSNAKILITDQNIDFTDLLLNTNIEKIIFLGDEKVSRKNSGNVISIKDIHNQNLPEASSPVSENSLGAIFYTSGTTSKPKGCAVLHKDMIAVFENINAYLNYKSSDVFFNYGNTGADYPFYNIFMPLMSGSTIIPFSRQISGSKEVESIIEANKVTVIEVVPADLFDIFFSDDLNTNAYETLRIITSTGQALPIETSKKISNLVPWVKIYSMYGATECKRISYLPPQHIADKPNSIGVPIPNVNVYLVDEDFNLINEPYVHGELLVSSNMLIQEYRNNEILTNKKFKENPFDSGRIFFTGDIAYRDQDGFLYFKCRKDDMFKMDTLRIIPTDIEHAISEHPSVLESVVLPKSDVRVGNIPVAFIVTKNQSILSESEIEEFLKERLDRYLIPKQFYFLDSFPRTILGKADKQKIKDLYI